jgi:adenylate kinase
MRHRAILLMGPPGVGKGTQGKILGEIPGFYHLACGDVFRSLDLTSDVGKIFMEYSSRGELVPDDVSIRQWSEYIDKVSASGDYHPEQECLVLDGIPRNQAQAKLLSDSIDVVQVFHLVGPSRQTLVQRMQGRALHQNRIDDANVDVINRRLDIYEKECADLTEYYGPSNTAQIDGDRSPYQVLRDILNAVDLG